MSGTVLEVTPDTIKVRSATETAVYKVSNQLLTNTPPFDAGLRGKITEVRKGCKIVFDYEDRDGQPVVVDLEIQK